MSKRGSFWGHRTKMLVGLLTLGGTLLLLAPLASALLGGEGLMWSVLPDEPVKLDVCWENPLPADASAREWARLAFKRSWERYSRVIAVGWDTCQDEANPVAPPHTLGPRRPGAGDENIKIHINTTGGGQNPAHGSYGDHQQSGVLLNLYCGQNCVEHLTIHELGHALGYYHGEERTDWPSTASCPEQWSGRTTSWPWWPIPTEIRWGDPDVDSVMAYCSGTSLELSPTDIAGAQRYYGRHLPGTVLSSVASQCLSSHASQPNGEDAFGWECNEALDDQEWVYDRNQLSLHIQDPGSPTNPRCLDVDTTDHTNVQTWECHYQANQQWRFRRVLLQGYGGLCLTRPSTGTGPVTMQTCTSSDAQLWRLEPGSLAGMMRFKAETANVCLAVTGGARTDVVAELCEGISQVFLPIVQKGLVAGSLQQAAAVHPPARQINAGGQDFFLRKGGQIQLPTVGGGPENCLDVRDVWDSDFTSGEGGPQPGQAVQVFECIDNQLNQRWNLSGDIVSSNKCLSLGGDSTNNGADAIVERCDGSPEQDWDYYW